MIRRDPPHFLLRTLVLLPLCLTVPALADAPAGGPVTIDARFIEAGPDTLKELDQMGYFGSANGRPASNPSTAPSVGLTLDDEGVARILRTRPSVIVAAPRVTVADGQKAEVKSGTSIAIVSGYRPATAPAEGLVPETGSAGAGVRLQVQAVPWIDRKLVRVTIHAVVTQLLTIEETTVHGPAGEDLMVQLPTSRVWECETVVDIPEGHTLVMGMPERPRGNAPAANEPARPRLAGPSDDVLLMLKPTIGILDKPVP